MQIETDRLIIRRMQDRDLPDLLEKWRTWTNEYGKQVREGDDALFNDRSKACFWVPKTEIVDNNYDLSINRYAEVTHEELVTEPPLVILDRIAKLDEKIAKGCAELEAMLKCLGKRKTWGKSAPWLTERRSTLVIGQK